MQFDSPYPPCYTECGGLFCLQKEGEEMGNYEFWFIVGSQDLYGEEVLRIVD